MKKVLELQLSISITSPSPRNSLVFVHATNICPSSFILKVQNKRIQFNLGQHKKVTYKTRERMTSRFTRGMVCTNAYGGPEGTSGIKILVPVLLQRHGFCCKYWSQYSQCRGFCRNMIAPISTPRKKIRSTVDPHLQRSWRVYELAVQARYFKTLQTPVYRCDALNAHN